MPDRKLKWIVATIAITVLVFGTGVLMAGRSRQARLRETNLPSIVPSEEMTSITLVRGLNGRSRDLWPPAGGVTLLIQTSCPHCQVLLNDLAGRMPKSGYPRLQIVALDGIDAARTYLDSIGLRSVEVVEPAASAAEFNRVIRVGATPTLILSDSRRRVRDRVVGELGATDLQRWTVLMGATR